MGRPFRYLMLLYDLWRRPLKVRNRPLHLQVEPTDACNQNCCMCSHDRLIKKPKFMSFDQFKRIIDEVQPTKVNISGLGEPLLNRDICGMIRYAKERGVGVNFPTNLSPAGKYLEEIVDSGIDVLKISIDAATKETYQKIRGRDHFPEVIEAIININEIKKRKKSPHPHLRFNFALQNYNLGELDEVIRLASRLGVESVYVQYLDYVDMEDRKGFLVGNLTAETIKSYLERAKRTAEVLGVHTNISIWLRDLPLYVNKMGSRENFRPNDRMCYFPWFSTFIEVNGDVKPCPIFVWKRNVGLMGNIFQEDFSAIWNGKPYQELRQALINRQRPFAPCYQCIPQTLSNIFVIFSKLLPGWSL